MDKIEKCCISELVTKYQFGAKHTPDFTAIKVLFRPVSYDSGVQKHVLRQQTACFLVPSVQNLINGVCYVIHPVCI